MYADLRRRQRRFDDAFSLIDRALSAKQYSDAYLQRSLIYMDRGDRDSSRENFETFEKLWSNEGRSANAMWPDEHASIAKLKTFFGRP
jgi:Tfp pilus assembly protein PilF